MSLMSILQQIEKGNYEHVEFMIKTYGLPIDDEWADYSLLRFTLLRNNTYLAKFLIEQGCRLNKTNTSSNTPLHMAVKHNNEELVKVLIEHGAIIEKKNKNGDTPLHFAVRSRNSTIIELILAKMYNSDIKYNINLRGLSQLHIACMMNDVPRVEELVRCVEPLNKPVSFDSSFWPSYSPMHLAVLFKREEIISKLLSAGAYIGTKNNDGLTALHLAHQLNNMPIVDLILDAHGLYKECINPTESRGLSHFHIACMRNYPQLIRHFLRRGVEINNMVSESSDAWPGYTPLHFAVENTCINNVKLLLRYGADSTLKNVKGVTPLHLAVQLNNTDIIDLILDAHWKYRNPVNPVDDHGFSHFHAACLRNKTDTVQVYLASGVNLNEKVSMHSRHWPMYTALHIATENKCVETMKLLLDHGADVNAVETGEMTPLHMTCLYDEMQLEIPRMLLEYGANLNARCDPYEMTALHMAVERNQIELVKLLLQYRADPECMERVHGHRPLHIAVLNKRFQIIEELLRRGADPDGRLMDQKTALHIMTYDDSDQLDAKLVRAYKKIITAIVDAEGDINAPDVTGKTPLHLACMNKSSSGVYALLYMGADINAEDNSLRAPPRFWSVYLGNYFVEHIEKLLVLNLPVSADNQAYQEHMRERQRTQRKSVAIDEVVDESAVFKGRCAEELARMRTARVDRYSTLFSLISENLNKLTYHARNESLKAMVNDRPFTSSYPLYGFMIKVQLRKGTMRMLFMDPAKDSLIKLTGRWLPDYCSEAILGFLSNQELRDLTVAGREVLQPSTFITSGTTNSVTTTSVTTTGTLTTSTYTTNSTTRRIVRTPMSHCLYYCWESYV